MPVSAFGLINAYSLNLAWQIQHLQTRNNPMLKIKTIIVTLLLCISGISYATEVTPEIKAAVAAKTRPASETVRDEFRKPAEILALAGIKPGMKVADLSSGGGYYTDILANLVGADGTVIANNTPYVMNRFAAFFTNEENGWPARLKLPHWQGVVEKNIDELDTIKLGIGVDAALMVLFYHDTVWQGVNRQMMNQRIFNALKPGGVFLVIDHSAKSGTGIQHVKDLHRIDKQTVIDEITQAGFVLETDSDLLAHPEDTRDYPFTRDSQTRRDRTDRMVLKFVRPVE